MPEEATQHFAVAKESWRAELATLTGAADYAWLSGIVEMTLNERVLQALKATPPDPLRLKASKVEEHLAEASKLLDQCLKLRDQIFDLEAKALLSALEYKSAEANFDTDLSLAQLQLSALKSQVKEDAIFPTENVLTERSGRARAQLAARLALHNVSGGSLNFGQRVAFLSDIFIDMLRSAYERLFAAKVGLKDSFGVDTNSVPNYEAGLDELDQLVKWVRGSIKAYETGTQSESEATIHFKIIGDMIMKHRISDGASDADKAAGIPAGAFVPLIDVNSLLLSPECTIDFTITTNELILRQFDPSRAYRVVGANVSIFFDVFDLRGVAPNDTSDNLAKIQWAEEHQRTLFDMFSFPGMLAKTTTTSVAAASNGNAVNSGTSVNGFHAGAYSLSAIPVRVGGSLPESIAVETDNEPLFGDWSLWIANQSNYPFIERGVFSSRVGALPRPPKGGEVVVSLRVAHRPTCRA